MQASVPKSVLAAARREYAALNMRVQRIVQDTAPDVAQVRTLLREELVRSVTISHVVALNAVLQTPERIAQIMPEVEWRRGLSSESGGDTKLVALIDWIASPIATRSDFTDIVRKFTDAGVPLDNVGTAWTDAECAEPDVPQRNPRRKVEDMQGGSPERTPRAAKKPKGKGKERAAEEPSIEPLKADLFYMEMFTVNEEQGETIEEAAARFKEFFPGLVSTFALSK